MGEDASSDTSFPLPLPSPQWFLINKMYLINEMFSVKSSNRWMKTGEMRPRSKAAQVERTWSFHWELSLHFIHRVPTKIINVILGCCFICLLSIIKKAVNPFFSALVRSYLEWIQQQGISNYILWEKVKKLIMFSLKEGWLRDSMIIVFKYLNVWQM